MCSSSILARLKLASETCHFIGMPCILDKILISRDKNIIVLGKFLSFVVTLVVCIFVDNVSHLLTWEGYILEFGVDTSLSLLDPSLYIDF